MSDQTPNGEPQGGGQTTAQPTQPVTPPGESQTSQAVGITLESLAAKLDALEQRVGKRQSAKDKAITNVQQDVASLRADFARYEELKGRGMTPEDAQFRIQMEDFLKAQNLPVTEAVQEQISEVAPQTPAPIVDPQVTLNAVGLDANDVEVKQILAKDGDPTAEILALASRRKQVPAPQNVVSTGGVAPPVNPDLQAQYEQEIAPLRGSGNLWEISQVQAKYRRLGLEV